jgi:hypothetical protein
MFELVANVSEAGDIVVVGAGLFALDAVVGRLHANREAKAGASRDRDRANETGGA